MLRRCPNCNETVSLWTVIAPGLWKDRKITCSHCGREISDSWEETNPFVWLVLGVVAAIFIDVLDSVWYLELSYIAAAWAFLIVLAYYFVPFRKPR
jgi:CXXC-20-CXXC protein